MSALATVEPVVAPAAAVTRVGRNTAFRVAAQAVSAVINIAGMLLLGRQLSASGYGEYVFWYALVPLFASVADLGAGVIVTRSIARAPHEARRLLGDAMLVRAAVAAVLLAAIGTLSWPLLGPANSMLLLWVAAAALLDFSQDPAVWACRATERLDLEAMFLLVSQLAWLAGIAVALQVGAPLPVLIATAAAAFALRTVAGGVWLARRGLLPQFAPDRARLTALVVEGWPMGLALLLVVLYGRAGVFALQAWSKPSEVACFNVAYMLAQPLGFLASALAMAVFPSVSRLGASDRVALAATLRSANKYQWLLSLPMAAGLSLVAGRIVPLFFHDAAGFANASGGLAVVALALPFVFFNLQSRYLLAAFGEQRVYLRAVVAGLVVNVAGCALTARSTGAIGAAWTFLLAEAVVFVICQHATRARVGSTGLAAEGVRPAIAAGAMAVVVYLLPHAPLAVAIAVGAVTYAAALGASGAWGRAETLMVRSVIHSFRPVRAPHDTAKRELL
jgi:O-antigen/teichoic acid export membrane protein